jgi:hypothetical protein
MADPARPLLIVAGDAAGICDPETGVCALPDTHGEPPEVISESDEQPGRRR